DAVTLKFSIGRSHGVKPGNIVAAIAEETSLTSKAIGRIDVRPGFTLVDIEANKVDAVLTGMQRSHIRGQEVMVEIDSAPKRRSSGGDRGDRPRGDRPRGDRSRGDRNSGGERRRSKDDGKSRGSAPAKEKSSRRSGNHDKSVRKSKTKTK
ncbi:MAG: DbpA RNA binding domain-containing protein, partial [Longicatena sp.]